MIDRWMLLLFWGSVAITFYTQLGYPLLMRCFARLFGRPARELPPLADSELPSVSLVISAFNEEVVLEDKLRNALEIDYPRDRLEIVVASDGSRDRTVEIAQQFVPLGIRLLAYPVNRGKSTTLTEAVGTVRGDVLLLCDANVMFRRDALRLLVERLRDPAVGAVTGDVRLDSGQADFGEGESLYYRIERRLQLDESALGSIIGVDGGMYVLRRELFPGIPSSTLNDDFLLSMRVLRAGYRVLYEPRAVATETATMHAEDEFRRRIRVAAGAAQILRRGEFPPPWQPFNFFCWVSHKLLRLIAPVFLVTALISNVWLLPHGWLYVLALITQGLLYGVAWLAWWRPGVRSRRWARIPFYFVFSHVAIARGMLRGFLFQQSGAWQRTARVVTPAGGDQPAGQTQPETPSSASPDRS